MDQIYFTNTSLCLDNLPNDSLRALQFVLNELLRNIYTMLQGISNRLHYQIKDELTDEKFIQIRNTYTLCADQIRKSILAFFDVIKTECQQGVYLQVCTFRFFGFVILYRTYTESRHCAIERLSWCTQKLKSLEQLLEKPAIEISNSSEELIVSAMHFVNWIDQTFDILDKMCSVISRNDFKKTEELSCDWKKEVIECICALHTSVDELMLSAMTLCKYCLSVDQYVVKARCQVVMRETKTLISEVIEGDSENLQATIESLKLPIMPFNINIRIDILKDVLVVLETNTNTALLALVVHCFSQDRSPLEMLVTHFEKCNKQCTCIATSDGMDNDEIMEKCLFIKEFDIYTERLLHVGSFAMSCSSDQKRILSLRSGLASLEALDPHLVPAIMLSPQSYHANLLVRSWKQEVDLIRDSVFLIVDPAAFADKTRQMMHQTLLEIIKGNIYDSNSICTVINIGCVVYDFFNVYEKLEPDALTYHDQLASLLKDLNKVQMECKIVSNLLSSETEYKYNVNHTKQSKHATVPQLIKRLKLLYTLIKRINLLYNPQENDDEFYEEPPLNTNMTQTLNNLTYVNSPKKLTNNFSKSAFARTNQRSSGKLPLAILTKHLKSRNNDLSFSIKLDGICDMSELRLNRESILYHSPSKSRSSLRKVVLCKQLLPSDKSKLNDVLDLESSDILEKDGEFDEAISLQITDVLNQINDLTISVSTISKRPFNSTVVIEKPLTKDEEFRRDILNAPIDRDVSYKDVLNNASNNNGYNETEINMSLDVNTLERIKDLDLVESKLINLKSGHIETSL